MTSHNPTAVLALALVLLTGACSTADRDAARKRVTPEYDKDGKLQLLKYDSKGNGTIDTWSYMDGPRIVRIEIDKDADGAIDRWEHYGPDQKLVKVGVSTLDNGRVDRVEFYEREALVRAEVDTDLDGTFDKWEAYDGPRLTSVAFDTLRRGVPDRRLIYRPGGDATLELDLEGDGQFVSGSAAPPASGGTSPR